MFTFFMKPNFEPRKEHQPFQFQVEGDPMPFFKSRHINRKSWDSIQSSIITYRNNLENAAPLSPLSGPLFADVEFYLPYKYKSDTYLINRPHQEIPQLTRLIQFIEQVALEVHIVENPGQIASLFAKKLWSDNPRTQFILHEIVA